LPKVLLLLPLLSLLNLAAVGCGPPAVIRHADGCSGTTSPEGHSVEVYLSVGENGAKRPLCPGAPLHVKEALRIEVELDRAAYVDLIFVDPAGHAGALERQDTADLTRVAEFRAPSGLLTHHPGVAELFVVASEEPLEELDPTLHALLKVIHETGISVDRHGSIHPGQIREDEGRPLHFDTQAEMFTDFDDNGLAMLALSLRTQR
jgi:hypothetical protein